MTLPTQSLPRVGFPNSSEDSRVLNALTELQLILSGGVDASNKATAVGSSNAVTVAGYGPGGGACPVTITATGRPVLVTLWAVGTTSGTVCYLGLRRAGIAIGPAAALEIRPASATVAKSYSEVFFSTAPGSTAFDVNVVTDGYTGDLRLSVCEL